MSIHKRWRKCSSLEKVGLISFFISLPFVFAFSIDCSLSYFYEHVYKYQIAYCTFEDYIASENLEIKAQDYDFFWVPKTGNYEIVPKGMSRLSQEDGKYGCNIYAQSLWGMIEMRFIFMKRFMLMMVAVKYQVQRESINVPKGHVRKNGSKSF